MDNLNAKEAPGSAEETDPSLQEFPQEQEPRLKYERFRSDVPAILDKQAATRLCVSDKILALGTQNGTVHVLDYDGNEVRCTARAQQGPTPLSSVAAPARGPRPLRLWLLCNYLRLPCSQIKCYREHGGAVTDLSFDASAENLASCASDGSLAVSATAELGCVPPLSSAGAARCTQGQRRLVLRPTSPLPPPCPADLWAVQR